MFTCNPAYVEASPSSLFKLPASAPQPTGQVTVDFAPVHCLSSPFAADNSVGGSDKSH